MQSGLSGFISSLADIVLVSTCGITAGPGVSLAFSYVPMLPSAVSLTIRLLDLLDSWFDNTVTVSVGSRSQQQEAGTPSSHVLQELLYTGYSSSIIRGYTVIIHNNKGFITH